MNIEARGLIKPLCSKFTFLARCLDSILVIFSLWAISRVSAYYFGTGSIASGILAALLLQISGEFSDIYRSWRSESLWAEASQLTYCWISSFFLVMLTASLLILDRSLLRWPHYSQWFLLALALMLGWRFVARNMLRWLRSRGFNSRRVAVVGSSDLALETARRLPECTWTGYVFAGFYDDRQMTSSTVHQERRKRHLPTSIHHYRGNLNDLVCNARNGSIDCIFIALPMNAELRIQKITRLLANTPVSVYLIPDMGTFELLQARSINLNGIPAISVVGEPYRDILFLLKQLEDFIGSCLILLVIILPMLIIAICVKLTSPGPVFFRQTRYGLNGKPFKVWKFRTMTVCEDSFNKIRQASRNDSRLTTIGGFLRRTSLDELPQFFNVLQGNMSIVGPRPHAVAHNEMYREKIQGYMLRHKFKPGITGWAQVNGWRGETDTLEKMQKRIEFDLDYIRHWSLGLDLKIVLLTIWKGFRHVNAY